MIIFQGFGAGQAAKKAEDMPTLAVVRREYGETYAALQRLDAALSKGDIRGAQAIAKGLSKWATETSRAVRQNRQLMSRIGGVEYNIDRLVPGTEANLSFMKYVGELTPERKTEIISYVSEGLAYAKENALKAGSLLCLGEALSIKNRKIANEILDVMASAQAPEDYLKIFDPKAKLAQTGFFTSENYELRDRKPISIQAKNEETGQRFPAGSPLAKVDGMVADGNFEGAREIVSGKYNELSQLAPIKPIALKPIKDVDSEAGLWETFKKGGELIVPGWGETTSTIRAVEDFKAGKYVLGTVNSLSALLQLAMDAAAILSIGRLSRLTTKGKQAIRGLAKLAENEFEKTVAGSVEKALSKELGKGIAKTTFEGLEKGGISKLYKNTLDGTRYAVETAGRGAVDKKGLAKIAKETAKKEVDVIRTSEANMAALETERILSGGIGEGVGGRASRVSKSAREKVSGWISEAGKNLSLTNREAAAVDMRKKASALRIDGKQLRTEEYVLPYLAKPIFKPWKAFTLMGKHANGLTAKALERQAWTLEKSVAAQNYVTRKFLAGKGAISPYFKSTPLVNITKSNAYWWARITNASAMAGTELPGSKLDKWVGYPLGKSMDFVDGKLGSIGKGTGKTSLQKTADEGAKNVKGEAVALLNAVKGDATLNGQYNNTINLLVNGGFGSEDAVKTALGYLEAKYPAGKYKSNKELAGAIAADRELYRMSQEQSAEFDDYAKARKPEEKAPAAQPSSPGLTPRDR